MRIGRFISTIIVSAFAALTLTACPEPGQEPPPQPPRCIDNRGYYTPCPTKGK